MPEPVLVLLLILGTLLRVAALPMPGTVDVTVWKVWSFGATHDLTGVYGVGGSPPERRVLHWRGDGLTVNYPPVALAELAVVGRLYEWWDPLFDDSNTLTAFVKLPGIAAEIVLTTLALTWGRRQFGAAGRWIALAIWLNPALLLSGAVLGYTDAQMAVPAVLALVASCAGVGWLAGALTAIAVLTKPQAVFVLPVIATVLATRRGWWPVMSGAIGGIVVSAAILLPYAFRGAWANLIQALGRLATHDMLSANAANVWWIFTWVLRVLDVSGEWGWSRALTQEVRILAISRAEALGYPNARVVGLVVVGLACLWAIWRARQSPSLAAASALAGWCAYAYAVFAAQVHENHLYLAIPFFCVAAGLDRRYRLLCGMVSAVFFTNLLLFYGWGRSHPVVFDRRWTGIDASVLLAFANVVVFAWSTQRIWSAGRARGAAAQ